MADTEHLPHNVVREDRSDGAIILRSAYPLGPVVATSYDWLARWAAEAPNRVFLAERSGAGWREVTYGEALQRVRALAAGLLARGIGPGAPILILSGNGVNHGLLTLAAHMIGAPTAPVAEQYSLIPEAHDRLRYAARLTKPAMVFAADGAAFGPALTLECFDGVQKLVSETAGQGVERLSDLMSSTADVDAAAATVGPETVVKILMTSGSTSDPKGVETTHEMMCVNQTQIADALPFLRDRPPCIVDWLPWNHVFGGSHNFNMMLANGGSLYVDDGKPMRGPLFDRTVENLGLKTGTLAFNVPVGFALLLEEMRRDAGLRRRFFADLDLIFYAGASLPADVWAGLEEMALAERGAIPLMTSSWGLTETGPGCTIAHEPTKGAGIIGAPMTGVDVKLVPDCEDAERYEIRVRGRNIMRRYLDNPAKTAEAFDEEGYFATEDAVSFVDPDNVNAGLRFEGRIAEDFKLGTGTWVRAAAVRLEALSALAPLAADVVVTGHDRAEIGLLIMPNRAALAAAGIEPDDDGAALSGDALQTAIGERLAAIGAGGSSTRISRALVMSAPASLAAGEITAKGNLNNRKVLALRLEVVERLYNDGDGVIRPMPGDGEPT